MFFFAGEKYRHLDKTARNFPETRLSYCENGWMAKIAAPIGMMGF